MKNLCNKMRDKSNPYEIWATEDGTWEWHVLKKWQNPENEAKNKYARWLVAVKSPFTYGNFECGDTYVRDIKTHARMVEKDGSCMHGWHQSMNEEGHTGIYCRRCNTRLSMEC